MLTKFIEGVRASAVMEPACRALRSTIRLPERVWRHLAFHGTIDFVVAGRLVRMRHIGAQVENSLFWAGYGQDFEATSLLVWEQLAARSRSIYDIGANSGVFALAAKAISPGASVHAFEPIADVADLLEANIALNGFDIVAHRAGVSDFDGIASITTRLGVHNYSASLEHMDWMDETRCDQIEIRVMRLASLAPEAHFPPDLIKLDIERHEPAALRGLWPALPEDHRIAMLIEILDPEVAAAVAYQIRDRNLTSFAIREGAQVRGELLRHDPSVRNWLVASSHVNDWVSDLNDRGVLTHDDLLARRLLAPSITP